MKFLREPLVHFIFVGAVIYLLYGVFIEPVTEDTDKTIVVSTGEIEWMNTAWQKRWNRLPTAEELDGLIQQYIKETVYYREALTMGLNKHDQIIRRRLAQKLEFLAKDLVALTPPSEEELRAYFISHRKYYSESTRYSFIQVYIDPDIHGDATLDHAEKIKTALIAKGGSIDNAAELGDGFMLQSYYPEKDQAAIQKLFGGDFSESLLELTAGQWHGPVLSGYGVHLVYLHSVIEPEVTDFAEVRDSVTRDWETEKGIELNEKFYDSLREQYSIIIEQPLDDDKIAIRQETMP
jgi:hypothetical protein